MSKVKQGLVFGDEVFCVGDIVKITVMKRLSTLPESTTYTQGITGRVLKIEPDFINLDCSRKYHSDTRIVNLKEIVKIHKITNKN